MEITANILADSYNKYLGNRITTFVLRYPRYIHTHILTHRVFTRNTSSSRAIPINKYIDVVTSYCAMPLEFKVNKKGMQSGEPLGTELNDKATALWLEARDNAVKTAKEMVKLNVSKESVNRLLEPFMWIECLLTATDYGNFFDQRISELAQPEICDLATKMSVSRNNSTPITLSKDNKWHLPFSLLDVNSEPEGLLQFGTFGTLYPQLVCAGQAARVSFTKFEDSLERHSDIDNYKLAIEKLVPSRHWSPLEHCAMCLDGYNRSSYVDNLKGFRTLRNIVSSFTNRQ